MKNPAMQIFRPKYESGISLLMALIFLAGIMLIGMMTFTVSDTQYKQSGNQQFQAAALDSAETAISTAETWLLAGGLTGNRLNSAFDTIPGVAGVCSSGLCPPSVALDPLVDSIWANSVTLNASPPQQYIIQKLNPAPRVKSGYTCKPTFCPRVNSFRVIARGSSAKSAQRIVETTYVLDIN